MLDYPDGPNINPKVFIRGRQEGQRQRDVAAEPENGVMHIEDSGKVPQSHQL